MYIRILCGITFLPVTRFGGNMDVNCFKLVYKIFMCFLTWNGLQPHTCETFYIHLQRINDNNIYDFLRLFCSILYLSIHISTHPKQVLPIQMMGGPNSAKSYLLLLRLFPLGGVSSPNSWFPECSLLGILRGDPQCLYIPSDAIHPSPSWSPTWPFCWHSHVTNCSHFIVFFHYVHVSIPAWSHCSYFILYSTHT